MYRVMHDLKFDLKGDNCRRFTKKKKKKKKKNLMDVDFFIFLF